MSIQLRQQDLLQIQQHGVQAYPQECCGILLGRDVDGRAIVTEVLPLRNSRAGESESGPKTPPEILELLKEAYRLIQHVEMKDDSMLDWLERADEALNSARNRFRILPEDLLRSEVEARKRGVEILGFYHSHPDHPAWPSEYDRQHLLCPWYTTYLILAVENGVPKDLSGWSPSEDGLNFAPAEVVIYYS